MRVQPGLSSPYLSVERVESLERPRASFGQVLEETTGRRTPAPGPTLAIAVARATDAERTVDSLIAAAARGRTFTPAQLLALQATVARTAQTVEVLSRATDRVVGTVKQALNAQI